MSLSTLLNEDESRRFSFSQDFVLQKDQHQASQAHSLRPVKLEIPPLPRLPETQLSPRELHHSLSPRSRGMVLSSGAGLASLSAPMMVSPRQDSHMYAPYPSTSPRQHYQQHQQQAPHLDSRTMPAYSQRAPEPSYVPHPEAFYYQQPPAYIPQQFKPQGYAIQAQYYPEQFYQEVSHQISPRGSAPLAQLQQSFVYTAPSRKQSNGDVSTTQWKRTAPIMSPPSNDLAVELSLHPTRFLTKFDVLEVRDPEQSRSDSWFIGNQLAHHLHKENYNLFRSLSRKGIKMRRASKKEFEYLLAQEAVKFTVRCVTLVEFNPRVCDYIVAQAQKLRPVQKRAVSPSHLLSSDSDSSGNETKDSKRTRAVSLPSMKNKAVSSPQDADRLSQLSSESMNEDEDESLSVSASPKTSPQAADLMHIVPALDLRKSKVTSPGENNSPRSYETHSWKL
eukprot:TRINITY_DN354_c0_g1_i1.p2 TRINITY_DN354_c0_g1~~TRINITY_DN354_c0_g1_i1.p2  ORF type:complete len:448 (+),score=149.44 TRINITY_DN354_c0_g1_i1:138-1481(+)